MGICDKYMRKSVSYATGEEVYPMRLTSNGLLYIIFIERKYALGGVSESKSACLRKI